MDIESLAEFCSLVETHSFQETAARMNISQSALTKHIHKMEEELNITLFDRSQRSIRINEYSQRFYPHAKQILKGFVEPALAQAHGDDKFQFERTGYFVADRVVHAPGRPVFNLAVTLRDSKGKF